MALIWVLERRAAAEGVALGHSCCRVVRPGCCRSPDASKLHLITRLTIASDPLLNPLGLGVAGQPVAHEVAGQRDAACAFQLGHLQSPPLTPPAA